MGKHSFIVTVVLTLLGSLQAAAQQGMYQQPVSYNCGGVGYPPCPGMGNGYGSQGVQPSNGMGYGGGIYNAAPRSNTRAKMGWPEPLPPNTMRADEAQAAKTSANVQANTPNDAAKGPVQKEPLASWHSPNERFLTLAPTREACAADLANKLLSATSSLEGINIKTENIQQSKTDDNYKGYPYNRIFFKATRGSSEFSGEALISFIRYPYNPQTGDDGETIKCQLMVQGAGLVNKPGADIWDKAYKDVVHEYVSAFRLKNKSGIVVHDLLAYDEKADKTQLAQALKAQDDANLAQIQSLGYQLDRVINQNYEQEQESRRRQQYYQSNTNSYGIGGGYGASPGAH